MMHGVYRIKQCFCYTETSNTKYLYANEKSDKSPVEHIHYVTEIIRWHKFIATSLVS